MSLLLSRIAQTFSGAQSSLQVSDYVVANIQYFRPIYGLAE